MDKARLSLLTLPQRWDGHCLRASVLMLPRGDPLHAPLWDQGAASRAVVSSTMEPARRSPMLNS